MFFDYAAFKHRKDAKTVHSGLVGVFGLYCTPNLRTIYLWFEDMRRDRLPCIKALNLAVHVQLERHQ